MHVIRPEFGTRRRENVKTNVQYTKLVKDEEQLLFFERNNVTEFGWHLRFSGSFLFGDATCTTAHIHTNCWQWRRLGFTQFGHENRNQFDEKASREKYYCSMHTVFLMDFFKAKKCGGVNIRKEKENSSIKL